MFPLEFKVNRPSYPKTTQGWEVTHVRENNNCESLFYLFRKKKKNSKNKQMFSCLLTAIDVEN